ncbi:MAG: histidine kinase [Bacteroidetes bacterium]|nr:histidine kinase [Bacteroidota bacterium]
MKKGLEIGLHLFYWVGVIWVISSMDFIWAGFSNKEGNMMIPLLYGMGTNALIFYGNALFLYPYLVFKRKNRPLYWVSAIFALLIICYAEAAVDVRMNAYYQTSLYDLLKQNVGDEWAILWIVPVFSTFTSTLPFNLIHFVFSLAYRWGKDSFDNERQKRKLIEEKLSAELFALKSQINPHFLFNSLNNIYFLILQEKSDRAVKTLLMLSDILRYQLYECHEGPVPLQKEVEYIQNHIELEKIRQGENLEVEFEIEGQAGGQTIEPFIFINFIENAFKHSQGSEKVWVKIQLMIEAKQLFFTVENASPEIRSSPEENSGIGLANIRRRLELLYPEKYELRMEQRPDSFHVSLKLSL